MKIAKNLVFAALLGAILIVCQVALSFLPNIELVSVLIMFYTLAFPLKTVFMSIYVFVLGEGIIYGFGIWWIDYLYIWCILVGITLLLKNCRSYFVLAAANAAYGLCFGALCAIPTIFLSGFRAATAFWISGIPFDIVHCIGNFFTAILLLKPLMAVSPRLKLSAYKKDNRKTNENRQEL